MSNALSPAQQKTLAFIADGAKHGETTCGTHHAPEHVADALAKRGLVTLSFADRNQGPFRTRNKRPVMYATITDAGRAALAK